MEVHNSVGKMSIAVEIGGKIYYVAYPKHSKMLILNFIAGLGDSGKLVVKEAPEDYKFIELEKC